MEPMEKKKKVALIIIVLISTQCIISVLQYLRYDYDGYNCVGMSRDCEYFFESIGIHVYQIGGDRTNEKGVWEGHRWLLLDFGFISIPYESTVLLPFFDPYVWRKYGNLEISPGYVVDGVKYNHETELSWSEWT